MDIKKTKIRILGVIALLGSLFGIGHLVSAAIPCADVICVGMPEGIKGVVNGTFFSGKIDVSVDIKDDASTGTEREIYMSTDGGVTWSDSPGFYGPKKTSFISDPQISNPSSVKILKLKYNNQYMAIWIGFDALSGNTSTAPGDIIKVDTVSATPATTRNIKARVYNADGTPVGAVREIVSLSSTTYTTKNDIEISYMGDSDTILISWFVQSGLNAGVLARQTSQFSSSTSQTFSLSSSGYRLVLPPRFTDAKSYLTVPIEGSNNSVLVIYPSRTRIPDLDFGDAPCTDYEPTSLMNGNSCASYYARIVGPTGIEIVPEFDLFPGLKYKDLSSINAVALKGVNAGKVVISYAHVIRDIDLGYFGTTIKFTGGNGEYKSYLGRELFYKVMESNGTLSAATPISTPYPANDPRLRTGEIAGKFYATRPTYIKGIGLTDGSFAFIYDMSRVTGYRDFADVTTLTNSEGIISFLNYDHISELFYLKYNPQFIAVPPKYYGYDVPGKILEDTKFSVSSGNTNLAQDSFALYGLGAGYSTGFPHSFPSDSKPFLYHIQLYDIENYIKLTETDNGIALAYSSFFYKDTAFSRDKFAAYKVSSDQCATLSCAYKGIGYIAIDKFDNILTKSTDYLVYSDLSAQTILDEYRYTDSVTRLPVVETNVGVDIIKDELSAFEYLGNGEYFLKLAQDSPRALFDTVSGGILDFGKLSKVTLGNTDYKAKVFNRLSFNTDVSLQFKVVDRTSGATYFSPVKNLIYVPSTDGNDGSISYLDSFTNSLITTVSINMTCQNCDSLQLYQKSSVLSSGVCSAFGAWTAIGTTDVTNVNPQVNLTNGRCYQFKAVAENSALGILNEYLSSSVVKVDTAQPFVSATSTLAYNILTLNTVISELGSGVATKTYQLNNQAAIAFTANGVSLTVDEGLNRIHIVVTDLAGNKTEIDHFVTADLTPSAINVVGIDEGGVYASPPDLLYTVTQELTNVVITVNGVVRSDLTGLPDGTYVLVITGTDATGASITKTVNFTIDSQVFSIQVFSPQNKAYHTNDLVLNYKSSKPLNSISYTLNGGVAQSNTQLKNLADGTYEMIITATAQAGGSITRTVNFTVADSIPSLSVMSPLDDFVYTTNSVAINAATDIDSTLSFELDGNVISSSSDLMSFIKDGKHKLVVTATHSVSGNVVSRVFNFSTDTVVPDVVLTSPESKIYTDGTIALDYTSNKQLINVVYTLNGAEVSELNALPVGNYNLTLSAQDHAGRLINKTSTFDVATLDIISPTENQQIISNVIPPAFDFQYQAQGGFTSYTVALDDQQQNLLTPSQAPGTVIPLTSAPGVHDLTLRGNINLKQVGKRVNFTVGAKNISVGPGSIDYLYTNCDANFNNCDVAAELTIKNTGEFDVVTPFKVRMDHIDSSASGFESFWFDVASLTKKTETKLIVLPFKASLGDTLTVSIDPTSEIPNELANDNSYSLEFTAGKITDVNAFLSSDNIYFESVSAFNLISVSTAGPIASVEYKLNGWTFVNNATDDNFTTAIDMGLLDSSKPCVEIRALNNIGKVLDVELQCFKVSKLNITGLTAFMYDWTIHQSAAQYIVVNDIDPVRMMKQSALQRRDVSTSAASIIAEINEDRIVKYRFNYDPAYVTNRVNEITTRWADDGFAGGAVSLPNGHSVISSTIDSSGNACKVEGAVSLSLEDRTIKANELYAEELAQINSKASIVNGMSMFARLGLIFFNSYGAPYYWTHDLYTFDNFIGDIAGDTFEGMVGSLRDDGFIDFILGFLDLKIANISWLHGEIPENFGAVDISGNFVDKFTGDQCLLINEGNRLIGLRLEGYYDWGLQDASFNVATEEIRIAGINYSYLSFGFPKTPMSLHAPLLLTNIELQIDAINMDIPIDYGARLGIKIINDNLEQFGPFHSRFSISMNHYQRLANAEITAYQLFIPFLWGFGAGVDYNLFIDLNGVAKFDFVGGDNFSDKFQMYVDYDTSAKLYKRRKYCFLGACHKKGWRLNKVLWSRPEAGEPIPFGAQYTQQDVDDYLNLINAPWMP